MIPGYIFEAKTLKLLENPDTRIDCFDKSNNPIKLKDIEDHIKLKIIDIIITGKPDRIVKARIN